MEIELQNVGKRFNRDWIFRDVSYNFEQGKSYAITGHNGSGKSTLLQVIAGAITKTEGEVFFTDGFNSIPEEKHFKHLAIAAPYLELVEEMTANELLKFHSTFKPLTRPIAEMLSTVSLSNAANKQIRYYSSGMKQRLKLAQAFFSKVPFLFLDEPTTNLDQEGVELYKKLIANHRRNKLIIVCSNDKSEYDFCDEVISVENYKRS